MSYTDKKYGMFRKLASSLLDLTAAAVDGDAFVFLSKMKIVRLAVTVTTATVSNVTIVVTFKKYLKPGDSTNAVTIGTIKIPTAATVGQTYYKDVAGVDLHAGEELITEVTTAAGGGGAAGAGLPTFEAEYLPESPANQSNMVASA